MSSTKSRKDTRAVVSLVARYRSPATFEYVQEACCDVSVGGMFIKSASPAAAGTLLKLECEADASDKIRGVGRVVWLRREPNEHGPAGMGVKFVKLETGSKELIGELVKRLAEAGIEARNISAPPEQIAAMRGASKSSSGTTAAPVAAYSSIPTAAQSAIEAAASAKPVSSPLPAAAGTSAKPVSSAFPTKTSAPPTPAPITAAAQPRAESSTAPADKPAIAAAVAAPSTDVSPAAEAAVAAEASAPRSSGATRNALDAEGETVAVAPASSPSVPPEAPRRGGALRVWLGIAAGVAVLLAIIFADETPGSSSAPSEQTANDPAPPAASAPTPPTAASEPPVSPPNDAPAAHSDTPPAAAAPNEAPAAHTASAPSEPAAAPSAADPKERPAAHTAEPLPAATTKAASAATPDSAKADAKPFVIDFVTRPTGATVSIGELNVVAPGPLNLGPQMPDRVKVIAKKPGFQQSSAWIDHSGFETVNGTLWKRVYMTLPPDISSTPAPAPAPTHPH